MNGFGCGNDSCLWIIILLFCCGGNSIGGAGCGGCGGNDSSWLWILILLCCCGGNSFGGCGNQLNNCGAC